jgi:hypothetical protein
MVVMVGMSTVDYYHSLRKTGAGSNAYAATGVGLAVAAGRISYTFGLVGPAVTFDTACSASLVAMHYSVCAVRETASNDAVCAGANLILSPDTTTLFASCGLLAADGRCKVRSLLLAPWVVWSVSKQECHSARDARESLKGLCPQDLSRQKHVSYAQALSSPTNHAVQNAL